MNVIFFLVFNVYNILTNLDIYRCCKQEIMCSIHNILAQSKSKCWTLKMYFMEILQIKALRKFKVFISMETIWKTN